LEELHKRGAHVRDICRAAVLAHNSGRDIPFNEIASLDLQGVNVLEHVKKAAEAAS
jgi:hypothetical protein